MCHIFRIFISHVHLEDNIWKEGPIQKKKKATWKVIKRTLCSQHSLWANHISSLPGEPFGENAALSVCAGGTTLRTSTLSGMLRYVEVTQLCIYLNFLLSPQLRNVATASHLFYKL